MCCQITVHCVQFQSSLCRSHGERSEVRSGVLITVILCCACTAGPTTVAHSTPSFLFYPKVIIVCSEKEISFKNRNCFYRPSLSLTLNTYLIILKESFSSKNGNITHSIRNSDSSFTFSSFNMCVPVAHFNMSCYSCRSSHECLGY